MRTKHKLIILLFALLTAVRPAHAQSDSASYLRSVIKPGDVIWVTGSNGFDKKGILLSISDKDLEVKMGVTNERYPFQDLRLIEKPDSIANGVIVGALIGLLAGSLPAWDADRSRSSAAMWTAIGGGLGAAAGGYADSLREGRTTIFRGGSSGTVALYFRLLTRNR